MKFLDNRLSCIFGTTSATVKATFQLTEIDMAITAANTHNANALLFRQNNIFVVVSIQYRS